MAKYLFQANYLGDGVKGLMSDGGTKRVKAVTSAIEAIGGKLESLYYAFGDTDAFLIVDLPNHASATALALTASSSGVVSVKTTVLMTPKELDEASKLSVSYAPPGS